MVAFEPELHARLPDKYKPDQVGQLLNGKFAFKAEPPLSDEWTAQQMREATPWGQRPKYPSGTTTSSTAASSNTFPRVQALKTSILQCELRGQMPFVSDSLAP